MKRLAALILAMVCILALAGCGTGERMQENPFGHLYCIDAVLQGEDPDIALIQLNEYRSLYICSDMQTYDYEMLGKLETLEEKADPMQSPWRLFVDGAQTEQYSLRLTEQGVPVLSFIKDGILQWECRLQQVDVMECDVMTLGSMTTISPDWFYPDTFAAAPENLIYLSGADITGKGTVKLAMADEAVTSLTVYETYYTDGTAEHSTYSLDGEFAFTVSARYETGKQFAIYRIPCGRLECWFYLDFA